MDVKLNLDKDALASILKKANESISDKAAVLGKAVPVKKKRKKKKRGHGYTKNKVSKRTGKKSSRR